MKLIDQQLVEPPSDQVPLRSSLRGFSYEYQMACYWINFYHQMVLNIFPPTRESPLGGRIYHNISLQVGATTRLGEGNFCFETRISKTTVEHSDDYLLTAGPLCCSLTSSLARKCMKLKRPGPPKNLNFLDLQVKLDENLSTPA